MKKKKNGKKNKIKKLDSLFIKVFLTVFVCAVGIGIFGQVRSFERIRDERAVIAQAIAKEEEKKQNFENQKEYYTSDSYIEQIAREQLGMIKPNEILFVNRSE